ncbi:MULTISPECIES: FAD-dependent monooxygenase [Rhodococcus]|uniref:FAD-dependent monooxygenase n=1 Tax=Rhodococcus TaxID=1827 RepID=UPI000F618C15|nr:MULTISPECIES: FAD-dependent monooxygenase [Rhodococcus]AZI65204.1 FAD-dependent oxidoreductase [Rhodococcus sp. NJ-530]
MSTYFHPKKYAPEDFASLAPSADALPVVIVGAGPVGMGVAMGLAQRGIAVTILEAADQVSFGSRAICVSRHSLEVAERLGFGAELEDIVLPWVGGRSYYRDQEVLQFRMASAEHDARGPMVNVSQSEFEQIMTDKLLAYPLVNFHWSSSIAGISVGDDEVTLTVDTAFGTRELRAAWVVAADGGRSKMRELSGIRLQGNSYEGNYVIADIHWESELPAERLVWFDAPSNPGSTIIMHRQPRDIWRIDYQLDASDDPEAETQEDRIRDRITRHLEWLQSDIPWTLEWFGFYRAHALALEDFTHGRVLFAGDAAHLVPIFGVRGLNSGMEDAETLVWQLAAVINGAADSTILDAYSKERRSAWQQNVDNAGKSTLIMSPGSHGYRTTRDAVLEIATKRSEFAHLINPRQSSATHARLSPLTWPTAAGAEGVLPGDPLEDRVVQVSADGSSTSLNSLRGTGFGLLAFGLSAELVSELDTQAEILAQALAPETVRVITVGTTDSTVPDAEGNLASALGARVGEIFVIRPDGLALCRISDPTQLNDVAKHLTAGTAPTHFDTAQSATTAVVDDEGHREHVWLALSNALDQADPSDREAMLVRLALILGSQATSTSFDVALKDAALKDAALKSATR